MRRHLGDTISALIDIRVSDDQQNPCRRTLDQAACSLKHGNARAFGTDQRAGHVEAVFRKKKIQVVSRNPARNLRIALSNQIAVLIPQRFQSGVNPASPAAFPNDCVQFLIAGLTYFHSQAIVCQDLQFLDVVIRLPRHDRVHATRVVTNHSAQSATVMRSGIRSEGQVVLLSGVAQMVENYTGCTRATRRAGSTSKISAMYLEKSSTTATLQHCPAREVPPPRQRMGALNSRASVIAATTSSASRGSTTPIGT